MDAQRWQQHAQRLLADPATDPTHHQKLEAVACHPVDRWTPDMVQRAQLIVAAAEPDPFKASHPAQSPPTGGSLDQGSPPTQPFDYDHTIDGLRGIPITELSCVTPGLATRMETYGLATVYDLLVHVPLRYVDRSQTAPITTLTVGQPGTFIGAVISTARKSIGTRPAAEIEVKDGTGVVRCTFFNMPWKAQLVEHGDEVVVMGKLDSWTSPSGRTFLTMNNPLLERTGSKTAPLIPVYPQTGVGRKDAKNTVTTWEIHRAAMEAVQRLGDLTDPIPTDRTSVGDLMSRVDAFRLMHNPTRSGDEAAARHRLAYDELLRMQLALRMRRLADATHSGVDHHLTGDLTDQLINSLPFPLTGAQQRAVTQIGERLTATQPLHCLLQGDVGAGKSLVALLALLMGVEGGHQGALMAPTDILAGQLHHELVARLEGVNRPDGKPVRVERLTGAKTSRARRELIADVTAGQVDILVGTHALFSDDVKFASLGVVVIDEQHRFGVEQRAALTAKGGGRRPDTLVMTATPIPRTAAMTVFGDLDVIVLDELPPGRTPIDTSWRDSSTDTSDPFDETWTQVRSCVAAGRQAYVVCPMVEDSETKAAASATATATELAAGALSGLRVAVAHGKQPPAERDSIMAAFAAGELDVLVATTVIEVGVNVPNAAIIVILDPKQFGIAQLHQLRGRVGRGQWASTCILAGPATGEAARRMDALVQSTDGFWLSERDLEIRGSGQILGTAQHGLSDLRVASLDTDKDLLTAARSDAANLLESDPTLARRPGLRAEVRNAVGVDADAFLTAT